MTTISWVIFFIIIYLIWRYHRLANKVVQVHGHWQHYFEDGQFSTQEVYGVIDSIIKAKEIPGLKVSAVSYSEGDILSANRQYMRISRDMIVFDICAAPFAKGFFISSWQGELPDFFILFLNSLPFVGKSLVRSFNRKTYYQLDAEQMYITAVHSSIMEAIDNISTKQGFRSLTLQERELHSPTKEKLV